MEFEYDFKYFQKMEWKTLGGYMKELIGSAVLLVGMLGAGSFALKKLHHAVQVTVLTKISQGQKPLPKFTKDW